MQMSSSRPPEREGKRSFLGDGETAVGREWLTGIKSLAQCN